MNQKVVVTSHGKKTLPCARAIKYKIRNRFDESSGVYRRNKRKEL